MLSLKFHVLTRNGCEDRRKLIEIFEITKYHMIRETALCTQNGCKLPQELATPTLHANNHIGKIVYSCSSTHTGNSVIVYYPQNSNSLLIYIFSINGDAKFAVHRHRPATVSFDPFACYSHFSAKLYSSI